MEGGAHRQHDGTLRPPFDSDVGGAFDGGAGTADDDLIRRVVVGDGADLVPGRFLGDVVGRGAVDADERRHRALAHGHGLLHRPAAGLDEPGRVGEADRTGRRQGGIFAQRMAGDESAGSGHIEAAFTLQNPPDRMADRHQGRLRVFRQDEVLLRALEHQPGEVLTERLVDLLEHLPGGGEGLRQLPPHAKRL